MLTCAVLMASVFGGMPGAVGAVVDTGSAFIPRIAAFHDGSGKLTQAQVASSRYASRFSLVDGVFRPGYARGAWWLRLHLPDGGQAPRDAWLYLRAPTTETLELWLPRATHDGHVEWRSMSLGPGQRLPAGARAIGRGIAVPVQLSVGGGHYTYLRLAGSRPLSLARVRVLSNAAMARFSVRATASLSATLTILVLMFITAAIFTVILRDTLFLAFALQLAAMLMLVLATWPGFSSLWGNPLAAQTWHNCGDALVLFSSLFMGYALLDLRHNTRRLARILRWVMAATGLSFVLVVLRQGHWLSILAYAEALIINPLFIALAAWAVWKRHPLAVWPLVAYVVGGGGAMLDVAEKLGWLHVAGGGGGTTPASCGAGGVCSGRGDHARQARAASRTSRAAGAGTGGG